MAASEGPDQGREAVRRELAHCASSAEQLLPPPSSPTAAVESELMGALIKAQEENLKHVDVLEGQARELQDALQRGATPTQTRCPREIKEELAAHADTELEEMRAELEVVNRGRLEEAQQQLAAVQRDKEQKDQEVSSLRERMAAAEEAATRKAAQMAAALRNAQDYIGQLMSERSQIDKKFHDMKNDLITLLQNACSQRDEARWCCSWRSRSPSTPHPRRICTAASRCCRTATVRQ